MESRARRRVTGALAACVLGAACGFGAARASVGPREQSGVFALLGGTPKIASKLWAEHDGGSTATLKVRQFRRSGAPILVYAVDMQMLMHVIVVRDDFATFAHLHPAFDAATGTFSQRFTKAPNHRYYVYADSKPRDIGQQVFRFTMESDGPTGNLRPSFAASGLAVPAGPYAAALAATTLPANRTQRVKLTISQGGRPARGLGTYLGAAAHAVFVNTSTLAYVHVHPMAIGAPTTMTGMAMDMGGPAGPVMEMEVPPLPAGAYKLWIQFRGADGVVYTAAFTLRAR